MFFGKERNGFVVWVRGVVIFVSWDILIKVEKSLIYFLSKERVFVVRE